MASNPRIDDLRKRLEKEPGSRLFAQLAEELRKAGELAEAIRVCREGLQKHPAYPSARMTLGRALVDTGDLAAARAEFEVVVKGAPDNILASRFLAECLEGLGDLEGAVVRYKATLVLAPGDKQIQARLQEVEARAAAPPPPPQPAEPEPVAEAATEAEPPPIPVAQVEEESFELERPYEAPATPAGSGVVGAAAVEPEAATIPAMSAPAEVPPVAPEPVLEAEAPSIPVVAGPEAFELEQAFEAAPPEGQAAAIEPAPVELVAPPPAPPAPVPMAAAVPQPAPEPTREPAPAIASPTLAELYFNQGHTDKAIEVYRQLLEREPGNGRIQARLAELTALERHLRGEAASPTERAPVAAPDPRQARREALERTIGRLEGFLAAVRKG